MNTLKSILAAVKRNPVRVGTAVIAVVILVVSFLTHVPVVAVILQLAALVATFERVRASVTPYVSEVVKDITGDPAAPVTPPAPPVA